jgi:GNAT superfamily N-acetyltransferase
MNEVLIRPAAIADAEGIARVHVNAWKETYRGFMPDSVLDTLSIERRTDQWKTILANPDDVYHLAFVAERSTDVIGFANYGREREGDPEYQGELYSIYLLKEFQGQGIGRSLLQKTVEGLLTLEIESMLVWVLADNPYREFYKRLGAVVVRDKTVEIGGVSLKEQAYVWKDIRTILMGTR